MAEKNEKFILEILKLILPTGKAKTQNLYLHMLLAASKFRKTESNHLLIRKSSEMHRKINARGVDNNSNYNSKKLETTYVHYYLYGNWCQIHTGTFNLMKYNIVKICII